MKKIPLSKYLLQILCGLGLVLLFAGTSSLLHAESVKMILPAGDYAKKLGTHSIADPSGATHTREEVKGKVVVGIFSAPNMSQGDKQEKWANLLANQADTKVSDEVRLFLVEDMSQAGMFKGMALSQMKKEFTPTSRPFLVLDQDGNFFKKFGVARGKTVILIYDKTGALRDVEENLDDQATTIQRIKAITKKLLAE